MKYENSQTTHLSVWVTGIPVEYIQLAFFLHESAQVTSFISRQQPELNIFL